MAINLQLFNRIIKLTFYRQNSLPLVIPCPAKGRKPKIELNATVTAAQSIPAFNITIKNLYLDLRSDVYTKVRVEAGYEGQMAVLEGSINTIYQESPGPEGTTVIQCWEGEMKEWLDTYVNVAYDPGTYLNQILVGISKNLNVKGIRTGDKAAELNLKEPFVHNGSVRDAITKLRQLFADSNLVIFIRNDILIAICLTEGDYTSVHTLQYMSGPPQFNNGDSEGSYNMTITAPWDPSLQPGDMLIVPSSVYQKYENIVGAKTSARQAIDQRTWNQEEQKDTGTQKIQITRLSFHFGTCGGTNSMTVEGFLL